MTLLAEALPKIAVPLHPSEVDEILALSKNQATSDRSTSESSRALLGLLSFSQTASAELAEGSPESTLEGVISRAVLRSLLGALHQRDVATVRHSRRVALLAVGLAHHLGWEGRHLRVLEVAALLHDIGKIGVPDNVLYKPGKLSPEEIELMALHYNIGIDVLQACRVDGQVLEIVDQSQRAYSPGGDGSRRLGREIHMGARILAVADAYESLCTEQVYRRAKSHDEIMKLLTEGSGTQFDGNIVSALARWVQQDGLPFAAQTAELNDVVRHHIQARLADAGEAGSLCQIISHLHTLESLYDGFHLLDADHKFLIWNRGTESLFGRPAGEMLGRQWNCQLLGYRDSAGTVLSDENSPLRQAAETGRTVVAQLEALRADGQPVQIELQAVPLFDAAGQLCGVAEIFRDLARNSGKRPQEFRELKLAATRDALTNVANRGELETQLQEMVAEFNRHPGEPFSVIFADADHFKRINDTYGHQVGDQVLIDLAKLLTRETYSGELVGRYGGEEFVVLCPGTSIEQAVRRAERLRTTLRETKIGGIERLRVTSSFGVAQAEPGDTVESVLRRADKALYKAKEGGRDRTCSLTNIELLQAASRPDSPESETANPFLVSGSFTAVLASEMVVYKLGGFVSDHKAILINVNKEHVLMRLDHLGWLSLLNWTTSRPPVEIELTMAGLNDSRSRASSQKLRIGVTIRPQGWVRDASTFQNRAKGLLRELKQYFAAD